MAHMSLAAAKKAKQDEFYTQWVDIEREMNAYLEYDPDVFRDKVAAVHRLHHRGRRAGTKMIGQSDKTTPTADNRQRAVAADVGR